LGLCNKTNGFIRTRIRRLGLEAPIQEPAP
jgi:hypothetical protein